jgi:hypothetical protein
MNVDKAVLMFAGFVVLLGLALGYTVNPYWYLPSAFAGLNMFRPQSPDSVPRPSFSRNLACETAARFHDSPPHSRKPAITQSIPSLKEAQ